MRKDKCRLTSNIVEVVSEAIREGVVTTLAVDSLISRILPTALLLIDATGLRNLVLWLSSSVDNLPILPLVNSTALELPLNSVPCSIHSIVIRFSIVVHPLLHVGLDGGVQVSFQHESSDTGTNL